MTEGGSVKRLEEAHRSEPASFLEGGGEMGERIRALDWSKTPLGPVSSWSQALRTMVGLLLRNQFPFLLWWGPEFVQIYNDAYQPIPGVKHPRSLGQAAKECWSEIWHIIGPMIEAPFSGQPATSSDDLSLLVNRKGFLEETHFKVAYSPVPDETIESTGIGGVLATVAETTAQVYGERQLRTLRELGARAAEAKTAEEACKQACATFRENAYDVPFALFYLLDKAGTRANLAATCGFDSFGLANPSDLEVNTSPHEFRPWPLTNVVKQRRVEIFVDLVRTLGPLPTGCWRESPRSAIALPLAAPDQLHPYGVLIAGVSPHRALDEGYRTFFELAAGQVVTAIRNALAYQEERKRAEALAALDHAKTTFFSNISHELRTPLTLMLGPIEDELRDNPAARPRLELAQRNSLRLLKLVNTLLDFSRIEAGRIEASYEPIDLAAYSAELASMFRAATEKAGLRLVVDCPPLPERVYVDREMWEKIVLNLLSNAFKFTFDGEIRVVLRQHGERVELAVSDTGVGIAESELPRVFERFHRVRGARSRTHEGTGIGLALVQELAGLHGGEVKVESQEGIGTTFTVSIQTGTAHLPAERIGVARQLESTSLGAASFLEEAMRSLPETETADSLSATETPLLPDWTAEPAPGIGPAPSQQRARILYAEDNADMREYVRRLLAQRYQVEAVSDGQIALERAQAHPPDLVLTDVMMPRLDGFGLLQKLRANDRTRVIPVVMLSARAGEEARIEGLDAGADDYLIKPFSARELLARVHSQLEMNRLRREGEERVTRVLESIADGFQVLDASWRFTYMNPSARRMLAAQGTDADTLIGKHLFDEAFPGTLGGALKQEFKRAMTARVPVELEHFHEPWQRWYGVRAYPIEQGGLAIYFRDITEKKQTEEVRKESERLLYDRNAELAQRLADLQNANLEIQNARRAALNLMEDAVQAREAMEALNTKLSESEERFRLLADTAPVLIWVTNLDGVEYVNREYLQFLGRTMEDVRGMNWARAVHPDDAETYLGAYLQAFEERTPFEAQVRIRREAGEYRWMKSAALPRFAANGRFLGYVGCSLDITDVKQYQEVLAEADRRKNEFLAMLAHELRNPLAPIRNALEVMRQTQGNGEAVHSASEMMERQVGQMARLVDDLLDVSRISRGKIELRRGAIELASAVNQAVEASRPMVESKGIDLSVSLPPEPVYLNADPIRLAQVVGNLLNNACKFTDKGGRIWLTSELTSERDQSPKGVLIRVRDTGIGIAADQLGRIFEMFTQLDTSLERNVSGLGIGLTLAKNLVELHGGTMEAHSAGAGQGSEFVVRLPVLAEAPKPQTPEPAATELKTTPSRRILVVDDNEDSAESLTILLSLGGHETHTAHDGLEAIEAAEMFRPEVILLDIGLPKLNGFEVARKIREHPWGQTIMLVALTGWGQEEDRRRSQEAGFNHHLTKPVDPLALTKLLARLSVAQSCV
jgi:PAS domain S-box-containing protein